MTILSSITGFFSGLFGKTTAPVTEFRVRTAAGVSVFATRAEAEEFAASETTDDGTIQEVPGILVTVVKHRARFINRHVEFATPEAAEAYIAECQIAGEQPIGPVQVVTESYTTFPEG